MRPQNEDVRPQIEDAPAISQPLGARGRAIAHTKGNGVTYTLIPLRGAGSKNLVVAPHAKKSPSNQRSTDISYMMHLRVTLPCFRGRGERDLDHAASLPALPVDGRGERPDFLHLLQHHADKLAGKKSSAFTDGKHELCIENILPLTSLQLGFAVTLTPVTLCRLLAACLTCTQLSTKPRAYNS